MKKAGRDKTGRLELSSNCFGSMVNTLEGDQVVTTVSPLIAVAAYVEKNGVFDAMVYADIAP